MWRARPTLDRRNGGFSACATRSETLIRTCLRLTLGLLLLSLGSPAAHANYRAVLRHGGTGSVVVTPAGGQPEPTISLTGGPRWSKAGFDGTIEYTYTETYDVY